ncbi:hypothetical protein F5887DRAFT_842670, partial [Amanita rubescens]
LLLVRFLGLLRLGEITVLDSKQHHSYRRVISRGTAETSTSAFSFLLPAHKADRFFEGNIIIITQRNEQYLLARDLLFPFHAQLWLRSNGFSPTRSWFLRCLHSVCDPSFGGHSL